MTFETDSKRLSAAVGESYVQRWGKNHTGNRVPRGLQRLFNLRSAFVVNWIGYEEVQPCLRDAQCRHADQIDCDSPALFVR